MEAYAYARPTTLDEATSLLAAHAKEGRRTQILAGGTDVLVQMRSVDRAPRTLIDVKHIADTNRLEIGGKPYSSGRLFPRPY